MSDLLRIRFRRVYVEVPADDIDAIATVQDTLEFMKNYIKEQKQKASP